MNKSSIDSRRELHALAKERQSVFAQAAAWYQPVSNSSLGQALYALALQVRDRDSLMDDEILGSFFEVEATQLLLSMPNPFWFWKIVEKSITAAGNGRRKIGAEAVLQGIRDLRRLVATSQDLTKSIEELCPLELASWMALGVLVVSSGLFCEQAIIRNPIFDPASIAV